MQLTQYLTDIANAIRETTGKTNNIAAANFKDEIIKTAELDASIYNIAYGSGGTGVNNATVNTLPGNIILAFICMDTKTTYPDMENGWTKLEPSIISNTNNITDERMDIWYKIAESTTESINIVASQSTSLATVLISFKNLHSIPILEQVKGGHSASFTDIKKGDLICCTNPWYSMSSYMKPPYSINIKCNTYLGWYKYYFTIFEALEDAASVTVSGGNSSYNGYGVLKINYPTLSNSLKAGVVHGKTVGTFTSDATVTADQMMIGTTAYVNGEKVEGTMANLGTLAYQPSDEEYVVPAGYTDGITIAAADITDLQEYQACLSLANSIDTEVDTSDATAKAEDIIEGKIAYSCGERLIGTMPINDCNALIKDNSSSESNQPTILAMLRKIDFTDNKMVGMIWTTMFSNCINLSEVKGLDKYQPTRINYLFNNCTSLKKAPELDTSKAIYFTGMFQDCAYLEEAPAYDASNAVAVQDMFNNCVRMKKFGGLLNLGKAYTEQQANYTPYTLKTRGTLDHESLMNIINGLYDLNLTYDVANGGTLYRQSLLIGDGCISLLSEEEKAIATNKGWNIS